MLTLSPHHTPKPRPMRRLREQDAKLDHQGWNPAWETTRSFFHLVLRDVGFSWVGSQIFGECARYMIAKTLLVLVLRDRNRTDAREQLQSKAKAKDKRKVWVQANQYKNERMDVMRTL